MRKRNEAEKEEGMLRGTQREEEEEGRRRRRKERDKKKCREELRRTKE